MDIRIPVLADKDTLVDQLSQKAQDYGLAYEEFDYLAPLYVPLDSELVTTLLEVYREKQGINRQPNHQVEQPLLVQWLIVWPLEHYSLMLFKQNTKKMNVSS